GLAGILRALVLPEGVRGARPETHHRAGESGLQPPQGYAARDALPVPPRGRDQARPRGAILYIIVALRPESATYLEHVSVALDEDNHRALYVPERFAHGYQALA